MSTQLVHALRALLGDADVRLVSERSWCSLTFCGLQLELSATVSVNNHAEKAIGFERILPIHEFHLNDALVADIAVTERSRIGKEVHLTIHALMLDI